MKFRLGAIPLLLCATILLMASPADASYHIIAQTAYADDGKIHLDNLTGQSQNYDVLFPNNTHCSGTLSAFATTECTVPTGNWAWVTDNVESYVLFTGNKFHATPPSYGRYFFASEETAFAFTNPQNYGTVVNVYTYYGSSFQYVVQWVILVPAYSTVAMYMKDLVTNLPWYAEGVEDRFVHADFGGDDYGGLLLAKCAANFTCEEIPY